MGERPTGVSDRNKSPGSNAGAERENERADDASLIHSTG
jgi:hypothetical protein